MPHVPVLRHRISRLFSDLIPFIFLFLLLPIHPSHADDSICAKVKIEINQELTLERQAFDAHMRINNGLSHITLESVRIDVSFSDENGNSIQATSDPDNTNAIFFIRLDSMTGIGAVDGTGTVQPSSSADVHWLIIPAPGASNGLIQGTLYYIGATLSYTIGGEEHVTEVTPDYIFVKPMPEMVLDYFLPDQVYGDDPFTAEIEPEIPFSLGVRVVNNGAGTAKKFKIDSAQPRIVEDEQGLLIGFAIKGSEVNGSPVAESLLVDFGDIEPNTAASTRWIMTCSLSGRFVEFTAEFSHSDELGGELTSLIDAVNTHFLVHDVVVDLPGRDGIKDFLAKDGDVYRVYESDNVDTAVLDQSLFGILQPDGQSGTETRYTLSAPVTSGFLYITLPDPFGGSKMLKQVIRSDGKLIKPENCWLSKTRERSDPWEYFFNIFDANGTGSYTVVFDDPSSMPDAPILQFIPDRKGSEERQLSFIVEASDPDGTVPLLSAKPLPAGARFTDEGNGKGTFDWTPAIGQSGTYGITFTASDGALSAAKRAVLTICSASDTDCDGMDDNWELARFGTIDRDGSGDFDGDGISDLTEYQNQTDPTISNGPSIPVIFSPEDKAEVLSLKPELVVTNSIDPDGDALEYEYQIYSDSELSTILVHQSNVPQGPATTSWTVSQALSDNTWYYWRVRATDGLAFSEWAYGSFFVNTANNPPGAFCISSPQDGAEVDTELPVLEVTNSADVDGDVLTYGFEVYEDAAMSVLVASEYGIPEGTEGSTSWNVNRPLLDNVRYYWKALVADEHGLSNETVLSSFFVNTINNAPSTPSILSPSTESEIEIQELDLVCGNSADLDGDNLTYFFELDRMNTFDSDALRISPAIAQGAGNTNWHVGNLEDNMLYFWRVKASDGVADSAWVQGSFFVNTANDAPPVPIVKNPGHGSWVDTLTPTLEVNPVEDIDRDVVKYRFEVYSEPLMTMLLAQAESDTPQWVAPALSDNTWYYWRVQAEDEHGSKSSWTDGAALFTNTDGIDDPPQITVLKPDMDKYVRSGGVLINWQDDDADSNAQISIYYDTDNAGQNGVMIAGDIEENPDGTNDSCSWDVSAVSEGTYYIYAIIKDSVSSSTVYSRAIVVIDRTSPQVFASPLGSIHVGGQNVMLMANEPATIYYTLDGSDPTTSSPLYTSPIEIFHDVTLKFMAIDRAGNESGIAAENYTILDPNGDEDEDGLVNGDEVLNETDPLNPDTDGDGHNDGEEVAAGSDPKDDSSIPNQSPVANAGPDQNAVTGLPVTLDGSASGDPEGALISYLWSFIRIPQYSSITDGSLSDAIGAKPTFVPDVDGIYGLRLVVNDGISNSLPDEVQITASTANAAPNANAGPDQDVSTGQAVQLDGSGSQDPDSRPGPLTYTWAFVAVPIESQLTNTDILHGDTAGAVFTPDREGTYIVRLTVSDGELASADEVSIIASRQNIPPTADAGADVIIHLGEGAILNGSGIDSDGFPGPLQYNWRFVSLPETSTLTSDSIFDADTASPSFVPDKTGTYVLELTVTDGQDVDFDNVVVTVEAASSFKISGGAYFCPEISTYKASFSTDVTGPSLPSGWLKYYYGRTRMNFVSTGITDASISGNTVTISGTGSINNVPGYTFTATATNGTPDRFGIVIRKPDGSTHYSAGPFNTTGGDLILQ